jgi:hypothetical protein
MSAQKIDQKSDAHKRTQNRNAKEKKKKHEITTFQIIWYYAAVGDRKNPLERFRALENSQLLGAFFCQLRLRADTQSKIRAVDYFQIAKLTYTQCHAGLPGLELFSTCVFWTENASMGYSTTIAERQT